MKEYSKPKPRNLIRTHLVGLYSKMHKTVHASFSTQHPSYNQGSGAFPNDVALLRLNKASNPSDISKNIIPVASGSQLFENEMCIISGWGVTGKAWHMFTCVRLNRAPKNKYPVDAPQALMLTLWHLTISARVRSPSSALEMACGPQMRQV